MFPGPAVLLLPLQSGPSPCLPAVGRLILAQRGVPTLLALLMSMTATLPRGLVLLVKLLLTYRAPVVRLPH